MAPKPWGASSVYQDRLFQEIKGTGSTLDLWSYRCAKLFRPTVPREDFWLSKATGWAWSLLGIMLALVLTKKVAAFTLSLSREKCANVAISGLLPCPQLKRNHGRAASLKFIFIGMV